MDSFEDIGFLSDLSAFIETSRAKYASQFELSESLNRLAMQVLYALQTSSLPENDDKAVAMGCYARGLQSFQISLLLAERGALAESRAMIRLCFEAAVAITALHHLPATVELFCEDYDKHKLSLANSILEGADGETPGKDEAKRLQSAKQKILSRYAPLKPKGINWAVLAAQCNKKKIYDWCYRLTSGDAAHITLGSLDRQSIVDGEGKLTGFTFEPDQRDLKSTLFTLNMVGLDLVQEMASWFGLREYDEPMQEITTMWSKLQNALTS